MWGLTGSIMHERKKNWKRLESVIAEKMSVCTQVAYACGSENIMRCKIEGRVDASGLTQTKYCNRAPDVQRWQIQEEGRPWKLVSSAAAAKSSSGVILDPRRCKHVWWSQSSESPAKRHCSAYLFIYLSRFQGFLFLRKEKKKVFIFWCYPNETLSPFPWRQSQNCQVSSLSKQNKKKKSCRVKGGGGGWLFFNCQKQVFKERVIPLGRWNFHCIFFREISRFASSWFFFFFFLSQHPLWLCRRMPAWWLLNM